MEIEKHMGLLPEKERTFSALYTAALFAGEVLHSQNDNPPSSPLLRWKVWLSATLKWSDKFTTALQGKPLLISYPAGEAQFDWFHVIFSFSF